MPELFFTHYSQNQGAIDDEDVARLKDFKRFIRPFVKTGVRIKGDDLEDWLDELEVAADYRFILKTGWTFSQLEEERAAHPYKVAVAQVYQDVLDAVDAEQVKALKAESKRRGMRR